MIPTMAVRIFKKNPVAKMRPDMSDEDFPVRRNKRFAGQKGVER